MYVTYVAVWQAPERRSDRDTLAPAGRGDADPNGYGDETTKNAH